ncbi:conserved domain protein [Bacteroides fluxus YIT 12057]|uniref:Conserved domain protein n=1 Tax=Bacteroides fluxus YIT 12057 TaxID=763034 RepID=F3PP80_9BACE|nr:conserved domain protein [Bacteroides fluxus YIT 12057]
MRKLLFEEKEIRKYSKIREDCYRLNQYITVLVIKLFQKDIFKRN